jgi:hypothetical protein
MKPDLSILICSVPSRWEMAKSLYTKILDMVGDKNIEVLLLMDNKKRTIGEKREALKNISRGRYFMFIDDDDDLFSVEEVYEAARTREVDVITFKVQSRNADGSTYIVTCGLGNEVEHNSVDGNYVDLKRPPFMQSAWNEEFKTIRYPRLNYAEDWGWLQVALAEARTQVFIDKVICAYNFNPSISEARI